MLLQLDEMKEPDNYRDGLPYLSVKIQNSFLPRRLSGFPAFNFGTKCGEVIPVKSLIQTINFSDKMYRISGDLIEMIPDGAQGRPFSTIFSKGFVHQLLIKKNFKGF